MRYPPLDALLAAVLVLAPAHAADPPTVDRAEDRAALARLKTQDWPAAYRDGDVVALARLLDDSFRSIDGRGAVSTRDDELAWIARHRLDDRTTEFRIERLEFLADGVAVVAGLGTVRRAVDGAVRVRQYRSTNVFVKRGGEWRAVASHVSPLPAPADAMRPSQP